jgi:predicted RNA binding protein YcfA (HicA-like mRNA interferase family)
MGMGTAAPKKVEKCLRHYGFSLSESYAHYKHNNAATVVDPFHGRRVATNQLEWVVKKGSVILPDAPIQQKLSMGCNFTQRNIDTGASVRFIFVATAQNNPPTCLDQLPRGQRSDSKFSLHRIDSRTDKNEIAYLDIHSSHIPRSALQKMDSANGTDIYYRCVVDAEFLVSHGVRINLTCAGIPLRFYETSL